MSILYLVAPGNISKAFTGIQLAATPERVSQDFVKTVLKIPGSSGDQMTSFLRRLGFAAPDGSPTEIYRQFRNTETSGRAMATAIKQTYSSLEARNEFYYLLTDDKLRSLILEATGEAADSRNVGLMLQTLRNLILLANFTTDPKSAHDQVVSKNVDNSGGRQTPDDTKENIASMPNNQVRMNLGYTINLNLPATTDIEVFNAIFKSLKEHLLNE